MNAHEPKVAVVVTTEHGGVFFGYCQQDAVTAARDTIVLASARMCVMWPEANHGVVGLAVAGPKKGARVGPAAPWILLRGVNAIMGATDEAACAWEAEPWS